MYTHGPSLPRPQEFRSIFSDERPALAEIEIKVLREEVELYSVLNHPRAREAFMVHQKTEFNDDNIEFWMVRGHDATRVPRAGPLAEGRGPVCSM